MIKKAREAAREIENARFLQANAEHLPFSNSFFDRIICTMSFHHYLHPAKVMSEIARVLKPAGKVCIVDPTADSFLIRWLDRIAKHVEPEHVKLYSSREFGELFEAAGLKSIGSKRVLFLWLTAKAHTAVK